MGELLDIYHEQVDKIRVLELENIKLKKDIKELKGELEVVENFLIEKELEG